MIVLLIDYALINEGLYSTIVGTNIIILHLNQFKEQKRQQFSISR